MSFVTRLSVVALGCFLAVPAFAEPKKGAAAPAAPAKPEVSDAELERQALEVERAEREREQAHFEETQAKQAAEDEQKAQREAAEKLATARAEAERRERQAAHDRALKGRTWGIVLCSAAVASGVTAIYFMQHGSAQSQAIRDGNLGTGADIDAAADSGHMDNQLAIGFGIATAVFAGVGVPLLVGNFHPPAVTVGAAPVPGGAVASLSLRIQ